MFKLCAKCNVCEGLVPEQKEERFLYLTKGEPPYTMESYVLVIDDVNRGVDNISSALRMASTLLGERIEYTYTQAVRCEANLIEMAPNQADAVVGRCAVWTNMLLENRKLILSTLDGVEQLKVAGDFTPGDMFISPRLGLVLVIPPLSSMVVGGATFKMYQDKVQRVLKEAGLR